MNMEFAREKQEIESGKNKRKESGPRKLSKGNRKVNLVREKEKLVGYK